MRTSVLAARLRAVVVAALALSTVACGSPDQLAAEPASAPVPASAAAPAEVEVDIFSGRPNPTWTLSPADDKTLRERLAALPAASPADLHTNLGYRGLVVHLPDSVVVRLQRGHVRTDGADPQAKADPERGLERWLLETGRATLEPGVYHAAQEDKPS
jgi:hypothetical protein